MKKVIYGFCFLAFGFTARAQSLQDAIKLSESEQFEKAAAAFVVLIQNQASQGDNYFYYGENFFRQEILDSSFKAMDLDSARMMYDMGIKKNPGNPLNYVGVGKVLWYEGKTTEAKKQFYDATIALTNKTATFTGKQKATVYMKIAECYIKSRTKDLTEATNLLNKALKEDPNNPEITLMIGDVTLEQNPGEASKAIQYYKKAYDMDKKSPKAMVAIGQLYNRARNLAEAVHNYDDALKADPNFAPAYREKAEAFYRGKQYETAITNYKQYLALNNGSLSAHVRYASFLYLTKKYNESITEILEIQKTNSSIPFLYRLLAYSYFETGKYPEGLQAIETFFSKASEKKILGSDYEYFGKLLSKSGKDSLAVDKLKLAIMKDTTKTELWGELGASYLKAKKYPEAIDAFNRKIKGGKNIDANDYYQLGRSYFYSKQFDKADTAFIQISVLQPDIPTGYLWRAKTNAQLDPDSKKALAKPFFEQFLTKVKPEDTEKNKKDVILAYEYLGGYYFVVVKDYNKAKCWFTKLKALDPTNKKANEALKEPNVVRATCNE